MLQKYENKNWDEVLPTGDFPEALEFHDTKEYVRDILEKQIQWTCDKEEFVDITELPEKHEFFQVQEMVNKPLTGVPSHKVITDYIKANKEDYRSEMQENPVKGLQDRTKDNTSLGRQA